MKARYRVAYIGWTGHDNTGDDLGPIVFKRSLAQLFPDLPARIEVILDSAHWHTARASVACVGTLIDPFSYANPWMKAFAAATRRGPLIGLGLGTLPEPNWVRWPLDSRFRSRLVEWFDYLKVRGYHSADALRLGAEDISGDSVFGHRWADFAEPQDERQKPLLAVNVGDWSKQLLGADGIPLANIILDVCRNLQDQYKIVLFSVGRRDDHTIASIALQLSQHCETVYERDFFRLASLLRQCTLGLTMKCHASGLLYAVGVPTVNVAYQPKCEDLASVLTSQGFVVPLEQASTKALTSAVRNLHARREQLREELIIDVKRLRKKWKTHFAESIHYLIEDMRGRYRNQAGIVFARQTLMGIPAYGRAVARRARRRGAKWFADPFGGVASRH